MLAAITIPQPVLLAAVLLAGLVVLLLLVLLIGGLFQARSLIRREFSTYFISPIATVVLVVFLLVTGYLFSRTFTLLPPTIAPPSAMSTNHGTRCSKHNGHGLSPPRY